MRKFQQHPLGDKGLLGMDGVIISDPATRHLYHLRNLRTPPGECGPYGFNALLPITPVPSAGYSYGEASLFAVTVKITACEDGRDVEAPDAGSVVCRYVCAFSLIHADLNFDARIHRQLTELTERRSNSIPGIIEAKVITTEITVQ